MRLIVSVDALRPPLTGIGRYTWELVVRLQKTPRLTQLRFYRAGNWVRDPGRLCLARASPTAVDVPTPEKAAPPAQPSAAYRWAKNLYWNTTCRGNVFHAPNYFLPSYARNGVVTVHDLSVLRFPETHPIERVRQWDDAFRRSLDLASQLITDTEATRQEVIEQFQWPAERVTAVPLGVSPDYRPRSAEALRPALAAHGLQPGRYVLCVATLEPRKRIDVLLAAYRLLPMALRRQHPLVLVGPQGWQAERLLQQVAEAQTEGWLTYLGFVPPDVLPLLYAGTSGFAYPSVYEGFGLPVVEAMASGVPVVTSNRSSLPEVAGGAAWLVDPDDATQLALALEQMLVDPARRVAAVQAGIAHAARFTWDACLQQTLAVYRRAAA